MELMRIPINGGASFCGVLPVLHLKHPNVAGAF